MDASKDLLTHGNSDYEKISLHDKIWDQSRAHPTPDVHVPDRSAGLIKVSTVGFFFFLKACNFLLTYIEAGCKHLSRWLKGAERNLPGIMKCSQYLSFILFSEHKLTGNI